MTTSTLGWALLDESGVFSMVTPDTEHGVEGGRHYVSGPLTRDWLAGGRHVVRVEIRTIEAPHGE